MANRNPQPKQGCLRGLFVWVCVLASVMLAVILVFVARPQDLSDVAGYGVQPQGSRVRDLNEVLKRSVEDGHAVTLSEQEINRWLARNVTLTQQGLLADRVSGSHVWVRLEDDLAEVIMERRVFGRPLTVSMFFQFRMEPGAEGARKEVVLHGGPYLDGLPAVKRGGRFGRLVVPQGYLHLVKPAYDQLAAACADEIRLAFEEMVTIELKQDQLVLNPLPAPQQDVTLKP